MSQMFKDYRPGNTLATAPAPESPDYGKTTADPRCCPVCWQYGKAIGKAQPCPMCESRKSKARTTISRTTK